MCRSRMKKIYAACDIYACICTYVCAYGWLHHEEEKREGEDEERYEAPDIGL